FLSLGENPDHRLFLGLAALGIIISAVFGLRAVAKIFFGTSSEELNEYEKDKPILDLKPSEIIPAGIILSALLFLGLWPRGVSDRIDHEISTRYEKIDLAALSQFTPACCLPSPSDVDLDNNQSSLDSLEKSPEIQPISDH
ncbi:MAG: hypothetical protein ACKVJ1_07570, partial [Verrucomicrobiia bacterium]